MLARGHDTLVPRPTDPVIVVLEAMTAISLLCVFALAAVGLTTIVRQYLRK